MLQKLTKKKALGTGPNCALQAEYALEGNLLITMLKVGSFQHLPACHKPYLLSCMLVLMVFLTDGQLEAVSSTWGLGRHCPQTQAGQTRLPNIVDFEADQCVANS